MARHPSLRLVALAFVVGVLVGAASASAAASTGDRPPIRSASTAGTPAPTLHATGLPVIGQALPSRGPVATPTATPQRSLTPPSSDPGQRSLEPTMALVATWTVEYDVGPANGDGANIRIPLRRLDGQTIQPGAIFDFWQRIGEVSYRVGYRKGALLVGDRIDPQGALAGGICTVSTALFNAAARAGLEILSRTGHGGYISRYPLGLDAAVAKGDTWAQSLRFRNDTDQALLLRTVSDPGIARIDLYAARPIGRTVTFGDPQISLRRAARDVRAETQTIPAGQVRRVDEPSDGMTVRVERVVRDRGGDVLHHDVFVSRYRPLRGLVLVGTG